MNKIISCAQLFLFLSIVSTAQNQVVVDNTEVTEVKVYQGGAFINRTGKANLTAGNNEVVFTGLSPYINSQNIVVKGTGDATILSVTYKQDYLKDKIKPKEIIALEELRDSLEYKHNTVLNTMSVLKEQENLLLANKSIGGANNGVLADELEPMVDYFYKKLGELKNEHLVQSVREKKLRIQLEKVLNELNNKMNNNNQPDGNIVVEINAKTKTTAGFELSYMTNGAASWYGIYDLRCKDINTPVQVIYRAMVTQNTGEDWDDAKLVLSTANPQEGGVKPELYPWNLSFHHPVQYQLMGVRRNKAEEMPESKIAMPAAAGADMNDVQMAPPPVTVSESQLSYEYTINTPYTINSDGQEHQVEIQAFGLPATYQYEAVPKLDGDVFLTARIAGWDNLGLNSGQANIYFDGAYVGQSFLNPQETDDTLTVSLGRDKRIVVKREKLKEYSSTKLFGGNKERAFTYEITVRNTKKEAVEIILNDQIPLSQDKDIEVKTDELTGGSLNTETGKVEWKLNLLPNESKKLRLGFTVKHPKDKQVSGL